MSKLRAKKVTIKIWQLQKNPIPEVDLVKPTIKIKLGEHVQEMREKPFSSEDGFFGKTLAFEADELTFTQKDHKEKIEVSLELEDVDVYGLSSLIATGNQKLINCNKAWWHLDIHQAAVGFKYHQKHPADLMLGMQVSVSTELVWIGGTDGKDGVEEEKETHEAIDAGPSPNYLVMILKGIEALYNEDRSDEETNCYIKVKYGNKKFGRVPVQENTREPDFDWCYFFPFNEEVLKKIETSKLMNEDQGKQDELYKLLLNDIQLKVRDKRTTLQLDGVIGDLLISGETGDVVRKEISDALQEGKQDGLTLLDLIKDREKTSSITKHFELMPAESKFKYSMKPVKHSTAPPHNGILEIVFQAVHFDNDDVESFGDQVVNGMSYSKEWKETGEDYVESDVEDEATKAGTPTNLTKSAKRKKEDEEKERELQEEKKKYEEDIQALKNIDLKPGDYRVLVDIIEVRNLKFMGEDMPDPVVKVEAWGQKKSTAIKKNRASAFFDQQLHIDLKDARVEDLMEEPIRIKCLDAGAPSFGNKNLLGAWQTDFDWVYYKPNHEFYRQWVPLMGKHGKHGVSGYLHTSITIVGPGDKPVVHDREAELAKEKLGVGVKAFIPETIQSLQFLVLDIFKVEDLPMTDSSVFEGTGIDAFVQVQFGDLEPLQTPAVRSSSYHGTKMLSAKFNKQLWIPYLSPNMNDFISITLWDREKIGMDELVASTEGVNLELLEKYPHMFKQKWIPFYGAQADASIMRSEEKKKMNNSPLEGACYKGRLLVSIRIDENKSKILRDGTKIRKKGKKAKVKNIPRGPSIKARPKTSVYGLRFRAFIGSELPVNSLENKFCIEVSIGSYSIRCPIAKAENGVCYFQGQKEAENYEIILPEDLLTLPDIFIYLVRNPGSKVIAQKEKKLAYRRFNAKKTFDRGLGKGPQWYELQKDMVLNVFKHGAFAGMVLLDMEFNDAELMRETPMTEASESAPRCDYQARVYIFQARHLPAQDKDGLLDPYINVLFAGQSFKTKVHKNTKNPVFMESHIFEASLPDVTEMPMMIFQVWDDDTLAKDDYIGAQRLALTHPFVHYHSSAVPLDWCPREAAHWLGIGREINGDVPGEILVAVELIKKDGSDFPPVRTEEEIYPVMQSKYIELITLGCRDLGINHLDKVHKPYVEYVLEGKVIHKTDPSCKPSASNPNFSSHGAHVDHRIVEVELPATPRFAPALTINAFYCILGGLEKRMIGNTYIPLEDRIPHDSNGRINPLYRKHPKHNVGNPNTDVEKSYAEAASRRSSVIENRSRERSRADLAMEHSKDDFRVVRTGSKKGQEEEEEDDELTKALGPNFQLDDQTEKMSKPPYMHGRERWEESWEEKMAERCPFEMFTLYTGMNSLDPQHKNTRKKVGMVKGLIRVMDELEPMAAFVDSLQRSITLHCRLYVLRGHQIVAKDENSSDPYLKVTIGNIDLGSREHAQPNTLNPNFFHRYDFTTTLPGISQLKLSCWDKDLVNDELIGETVIDLEDRWFNSHWQHYVGPKPVERRTLWSKDRSLPQGTLTCWLDMYSRETLKNNPPIVLRPPPDEEYVVRVVVWKTKEIPSGDSFENMSDQYVTCMLGIEEEQTQRTDIHYRAQDGHGSYNWRMIFNVHLPVLHEGGANLKIQVWDKDLLDADDCLCESNFNFDIPFKKAFMDHSLKTKMFEVFRTPEQLEEEEQQKELEQALTASSANANYPGLNSQQESAQLLLQQSSDYPLLGRASSAIEMNEMKRKQKKKKGFWYSLKQQTGLGPDPDYSAWLPLDKSGQYKDADGDPKILVSVSIMTKKTSEKMPAGLGREEPNQNPPLPAPKGRLDLTKMFNPFYLLQVMCGTTNCTKIFGTICMLIFLVLMVICGPFFMDLLTLILMLPSWMELILLLGVPLCVIVCVVIFVKDCAAFCGCDDPCPCPDRCGVRPAGSQNV